MVPMRSFLLAGPALLLCLASGVLAATTVTVKETHLCCGACVKAVGEAIAKVEGASAECDRDARTIAITAPDDAVAKKALTALADAGFHGKTENKKLRIKNEVQSVPQGRVSRIELTGIHNCCGGCNKTIKEALAKVKGIEADTAKAKEDSFVVEGDFNARRVIRVLQQAGFHVKVKKDDA